MSTVFRIVCLALLPGIAAAHPGHDVAMSALDGLVHPFTGLDHLLAMTATGLWGSPLGKRAQFILPIVFALAMLLGGALFVLGFSLPTLEPVIAMSVAVMVF